MPSTQRFRLNPAAAAALLCVLAAPAWAQSQPTATPQDPAEQKQSAAEQRKGGEPERVVITATGRPQTATSVPYNVTAVGEAELRERNITDLKSLIANSPSIEAPPNSARFTDSVTVRGLNISSVSANNIEWFTRSTLSYYLDDTQLPNIGLRIKDINRVETLLGPQGTLYGGGALGGVVRYITNKPRLGSTEARLNTSLYQTQHGGMSNDTDAVVNLPLGSSAALRVSLARLDEAGYTDRYAGTPSYLTSQWQPKPNANQVVYEDDDYQKVNTGRVSLLWRATSALEFQLTHSQQSQLAHGTSGAQLLPATGSPARYLAPLAFDQQTVLSPYPEFSDRNLRISTFDVDWNAGPVRVHSSTSVYKDTRVGQADYLATGSFFYGELGYSRYRLGRPNWSGNTAYFTFDNSYKGTLHETRISSTGTGPFSFVGGLYVGKQERSQKYSEWLPTLPTRSSNADEGYFENQASEYKETALFGEATFRTSNGWTATGGMRVFSYEDKTTTQVEDYAFDLVTGTIRNREKGSGDVYVKANLSYQLSPRMLAYATYSEGFRRGGANGFRDRSGSQLVSPELATYMPDRTENYEIGIKGHLMNGGVYLQANYFKIDWKDPQTYFSQDIDGFPVWGTTNGPDAISRGVELQGRAKLPAGFELRFATTWTEAEWNGTKTLCLYRDSTECRTYAKGGKLGGTAPWKHTLGLGWKHSTNSGWDISANARARYVGVKASDRGDSPTDAPFEYNSYTTYSANLSFGKGAWDFTLWGNNLSNNRELVSFQGTSAVGRIAGLRAIYLTPRTVGLNVSYTFR
jgi:outer membrane receptor protein involved in Fe transport